MDTQYIGDVIHSQAYESPLNEQLDLQGVCTYNLFC